MPAEMLSAEIKCNDVNSKRVPATTSIPNAIIAKGETIALPTGNNNRVYILATAADSDRKWLS